MPRARTGRTSRSRKPGSAVSGRLVQPQGVPPAHGDQVAEPHVRHLVQDRLAARLPAGVRHPRPDTKSSRIVTAPAFSIAPALNSGTKSWSYLPNGYLVPNKEWKKSKPCLVVV